MWHLTKPFIDNYHASQLINIQVNYLESLTDPFRMTGVASDKAVHRQLPRLSTGGDSGHVADGRLPQSGSGGQETPQDPGERVDDRRAPLGATSRSVVCSCSLFVQTTKCHKKWFVLALSVKIKSSQTLPSVHCKQHHNLVSPPRLC